MLDRDLAELYGVETRALNQAVKRNAERFPNDFMFQLTEEEFNNWKSQIVMSNSTKMGLRKKPLVFTEQGVAMLSSVLNSEIAITDRIVFNIKGNDYRLIVLILFRKGKIFIRFVGTHKEHDKVNAKNI